MILSSISDLPGRFYTAKLTFILKEIFTKGIVNIFCFFHPHCFSSLYWSPQRSLVCLELIQLKKPKKMFQFCLPNYLMCDYLENHCLPADGRLAGKVISQAVPGCYKRRTLILVHACLLCLMTSWMPLSNSYMTMSWKLKSAFQFSAYCALVFYLLYSWFKIIPLQSAHLKFFVTFSGAQNLSIGVF